MPCYIISYDLGKENGRDYESLYEAIKSFGTWAKITDSTWAVVTDKTASQLRDFLSENLDSDDRLIVIKSGVEAAWTNVRCRNRWLKDNL